MALKPGPLRDATKDPYTSFRFRVEIKSLEVMSFSEVTGLAFETEVQTFREGGVNLHDHQLTGPTKFPARLVLKRGLADGEIWSWYRKVMNGCIERKPVTIVLLDQAGDEKVRWVFREACPVKWNGPEFRAGTAEVAFESVELAHRGLEPGAANGPRR